MAMFLLEEAHVATVTGEAFGNPDCIRISYAASQEQIIEAVKRIKEALS
jgi:aspartate aminotransferase